MEALAAGGGYHRGGVRGDVELAAVEVPADRPGAHACVYEHAVHANRGGAGGEHCAVPLPERERVAVGEDCLGARAPVVRSRGDGGRYLSHRGGEEGVRPALDPALSHERLARRRGGERREKAEHEREAERPERAASHCLASLAAAAASPSSFSLR